MNNFRQIAMQRFTTNRSVASTQAIAFLSEYKELRDVSTFGQEIHYNMGRVLHQLGLFTMAIHQYQKVLELEVPKIENCATEDSSQYCLKSVAAYNMSLIYQQSGNEARAKQLISKYCRL